MNKKNCPEGRVAKNRVANFRLIFPMLTAALGIAFSAVPLAGQEIDLLISPGKLSKPHAHLAGVANCATCHTVKKKADPLKCLACHRDLAERIKAGSGWHRNKKDGCIACHPEHQGEDFALIDWDLKKFSHGDTGFPLTGLHAKIGDCAACHATANSLPKKKGKSYLLKDSGCAACHPDPHRGQRGNQCARCHSPAVPFKQAVFDHEKTRFPLRGGHRSLSCASCHANGKWRGVDFSSCGSCHADPHRPSLGKDCRACHTQDSWKTAKFDHERTRYPLRGKHAALACVQCHPAGKKIGRVAFASCSDCHQRDPHQGRFGKDCQSCHVVDGFKKAVFNHGNSRFPLTGKHAALACVKCHPRVAAGAAAVTKPASTACADCHADVHLGQFAVACDTCHTTRGFKIPELKFDHRTGSTFLLQGKHASISCQKCHKKKQMRFPAGTGEAVLYKPLSTECRVCHGDYHQGQLSTDCRLCHGFASFVPAPGFDHQRSRFALEPLHVNVGCRECHPLSTPPAGPLPAGGKSAATVRYKNIPMTCRECHREFDHGRTAFALTGAHRDLDCSRCHNARTPNVGGAGNRDKDQADCLRCHRSPHLGMQKSCRECHTGRDWRVEPW